MNSTQAAWPSLLRLNTPRRSPARESVPGAGARLRGRGGQGQMRSQEGLSDAMPRGLAASVSACGKEPASLHVCCCAPPTHRTAARLPRADRPP